MVINMNMNWIEYIVIAVVLVVILLAILKATKKDAGLDFNKLVELKDVSKANKEGIQKLGAKGIVEIDNQLKIILGNESKQLKKYIEELKK